MIAHTVLVAVDDLRLFTGDRFNLFDCFQYRNVRVPRTAEVVNLAWPRVPVKIVECVNDVGRMDIVAHLFALIAQNRVRNSSHDGRDQVSENPCNWAGEWAGPVKHP